MFTGMYPHTTGVYTFQNWASHRTWVQDLAAAGYFCANIGKMHFSPRDGAGGFHERPNFRNRTDPRWLEKMQGVPGTWRRSRPSTRPTRAGMRAPLTSPG